MSAAACHIPTTLSAWLPSAQFAIAEPEIKKLLEQAKTASISRNEIVKQLKQIIDKSDDRFREACAAILDGYSVALDPKHPDVVRKPFVLAEQEGHAWLREIVLNRLRIDDGESEFDKFLQELVTLSNVNSAIPVLAWEALTQSMPEQGVAFHVGKREAGLGSMGRQRFTAVVDDWHGGILPRS